MLTSQAIIRCKTIIDKYGSPTILDSEWVGHLNAACNEAFNRVFPDNEGGDINIEFDSNVLENFKQLAYTLSLTPSSGLLSLSALQTAIRSASGDNTCDVFRLLNMAKSDNTVIKFVKHNNLYPFTRNSFKAPTDDYPFYTILDAGYQIYPSIGTSVKTTVIKTPLILTNTGESLEFSDYMVDNIIFIAVKIAAPGIRDSDVISELNLSGVESAK